MATSLRRAAMALLAAGTMTYTLGGCGRKPAHTTATLPGPTTIITTSDNAAQTPAAQPTLATPDNLDAIVTAAHVRRHDDGVLLLQKGVPIHIIKAMDWDGPKDATILRVVAEGYRQGRIPDNLYSYTSDPWHMPQALAENDPVHKKSIGDMRRSLAARLAARGHTVRPDMPADIGDLDAITNTHQLTIVKQYCDMLEQEDWEAFAKRHYPQGFKSNESGGITLGDEKGLRCEPTDPSFEEKFYNQAGFNRRYNFAVPSNICYVLHVGLWHTHVPVDEKHPEHAASPSGPRQPVIYDNMAPTNDTSALAKQNKVNPLAVHLVITMLKEAPQPVFNAKAYLRNAWRSDDNPAQEYRWHNAKDVTVIDLGNYGFTPKAGK